MSEAGLMVDGMDEEHAGPAVDEPLPEETDNRVRPEDGPQDVVDQEPHLEEPPA